MPKVSSSKTSSAPRLPLERVGVAVARRVYVAFDDVSDGKRHGLSAHLVRLLFAEARPALRSPSRCRTRRIGGRRQAPGARGGLRGMGTGIRLDRPGTKTAGPLAVDLPGEVPFCPRGFGTGLRSRAGGQNPKLISTVGASFSQERRDFDQIAARLRHTVGVNGPKRNQIGRQLLPEKEPSGTFGIEPAPGRPVKGQARLEVRGLSDFEGQLLTGNRVEPVGVQLAMLVDPAVDDDGDVDFLRLPVGWVRGIDLTDHAAFVHLEVNRVGDPSMRNKAKRMGSGGNRRVHCEARLDTKEAERFPLFGIRTRRFGPLNHLDFADPGLQAGGTEDERIGAVQSFSPDLELYAGPLLPAGRKDRDQRRLGRGFVAGRLRLEPSNGRNETQQRDTSHPEETRTEFRDSGAVKMSPRFHHSMLSGLRFLVSSRSIPLGTGKGESTGASTVRFGLCVRQFSSNSLT